MSQDNTKTAKATSGKGARYVILALAALALFALSYTIASANSGTPKNASLTPSASTPSGSSNVAAGSGAAAGATGSSAACACCGGSSASNTPVEGTAAIEGGVQRINVDLSTGSYNPNTIRLKAGVPAEITFGQSSGCTAQVISQDLGFSEDLTSGPRTVKLQGLSAGEYTFSCGMQMVFGKVVVE